MPLPGCEPLPSRDASLGPTSMSPARVAWHGTVQLAQHGLAWLLMARHGTAWHSPAAHPVQDTLPPGAPCTAVFWCPLAHQALNPCFTPAEITTSSPSAAPPCCLHPPKLPLDVPWCRAAPGLLIPSALGAGAPQNRAHLATWRRKAQGAGGSVLTATSLLLAPGL